MYIPIISAKMFILYQCLKAVNKLPVFGKLWKKLQDF